MAPSTAEMIDDFLSTIPVEPRDLAEALWPLEAKLEDPRVMAAFMGNNMRRGVLGEALSAQGPGVVAPLVRAMPGKFKQVARNAPARVAHLPPDQQGEVAIQLVSAVFMTAGVIITKVGEAAAAPLRGLMADPFPAVRALALTILSIQEQQAASTIAAARTVLNSESDQLVLWAGAAALLRAGREVDRASQATASNLLTLFAEHVGMQDESLDEVAGSFFAFLPLLLS